VEFDAHCDRPFLRQWFSASPQDYRDRARHQAPIVSRPNAVEERNVLLRFEKARHPLVLCAMLPGNKGRAIDLAVITNLGGTGIALEQKRLRPGAGGAQRREDK
jgi:hypothetical protein